MIFDRKAGVTRNPIQTAVGLRRLAPAIVSQLRSPQPISTPQAIQQAQNGSLPETVDVPSYPAKIGC